MNSYGADASVDLLQKNLETPRETIRNRLRYANVITIMNNNNKWWWWWCGGGGGSNSTDNSIENNNDN